MQRDEAFEKHFPYPLLPTSIPGTYAVPALPDDFNPNTASAADLIRQGLHWERPHARAHPAAIVAWRRVFSRRWLSKDWITPVIEPVHGKTHNLRSPLHQQDNGTYTNETWAGSALKGPPSSYNGVLGFWTVPTVSKPKEPGEPQGPGGFWDSSSWVGLDGYVFSPSTDVVQAGVEQKVTAEGEPSYIAWYEWIVPPPTNLPPNTPVDNEGYPESWVNPVNGTYRYVHQANIKNFNVTAGQTVMCAILYIENRAASVTFANETTGQYFQLVVKPPPGATFNGSSAEWIMEIPNHGWPNAAVPKFSPVVFTECIATIPGCPSGGDPADGDILNLVEAGTTVTNTTVNSTTVTIDFTG